MKNTMKKIGLLFTVIIIAMLFAMSASAEKTWLDGYLSTEDKFAYEIKNEEAIIRGYGGVDTNITIPSEIEGYPVTTIGSSALDYETHLTDVTIPDTVTIIEDWAFYGCENLANISISKNVEYIGVEVFKGTKWYNSYEAGDLIYIENILYEFKTMYNANYEEPIELVVKEGTRCIAGDALRYLTKTTTITIPDSVVSIGRSAFNSVESLAIINIGTGIKYISYYAFVNCDNLNTVNYNASKRHWESIKIEELNDPLLNANINFNETEHVINNEIVTAPTCITDGYTTFVCSCGDALIGNKATKLGHKYVISQIPPSCTESGSIIYTCVCNDTYTETIAATGHSESEWLIEKNSTCTTEGSKYIQCVICEETLKTESISLIEHSYIAVTTAPTCTDKGYTTYTCSCGTSYKDDYVSAAGHEYNGESCQKCGKYCSCNCHKSGFMGFIWKITNFFNKLFKLNKTCNCGIAHY